MKIQNMGFAKGFIHFFYPAYCLYCKGCVEKSSHLLCGVCFELIEWIDPKDRCKTCWGRSPCIICEKAPKHLYDHVSLFDGFGPISSLYHHFLKTQQGRGFLSLILLKLVRSNFPFPDVIVPNTQKHLPFNDPPYLLSKHFAKFIGRPCLRPGEHLRAKTVLVISSSLTNVDQLIEKKREIRGYFPKKIFSLALIDQRF